ncbi:MAG: metallopeptidase family protein [Minisyncoccia bacterium]|jgi:predicted Zn-dependent protease with MMP-like domain
MLKLEQDEFEKLIQEGICAIPEKFLRKLANVSIVIGDEPTPAQRKKLNLPPGSTLLGLYEGVPQVSRGANYSAVPPDKITIFQRPIEAGAADREDMKKIVRDVVWHEIAHHFGMDESRVRRAEANRRKLRDGAK